MWRHFFNTWIFRCKIKCGENGSVKRPGKRPRGQKTVGQKPGGQKTWGAKGQGAKDRGANDRGANDRGGKRPGGKSPRTILGELAGVLLTTFVEGRCCFSRIMHPMISNYETHMTIIYRCRMTNVLEKLIFSLLFFDYGYLSKGKMCILDIGNMSSKHSDLVKCDSIYTIYINV